MWQISQQVVGSPDQHAWLGYCNRGQTVRFELSLDLVLPGGLIVDAARADRWARPLTLTVIAPGRSGELARNVTPAVPTNPLVVEYTFAYSGIKILHFEGTSGRPSYQQSWQVAPRPGRPFFPDVDIFLRFEVSDPDRATSPPHRASTFIGTTAREQMRRSGTTAAEARRTQRERAARRESSERASEQRTEVATRRRDHGIPDGLLRFRLRSEAELRRTRVRDVLAYWQALQEELAQMPPLDLRPRRQRESAELPNGLHEDITMTYLPQVELDHANPGNILVFDQVSPSVTLSNLDEINSDLFRQTRKRYRLTDWVLVVIAGEQGPIRTLMRGEDLLWHHRWQEILNAARAADLIAKVAGILIPALGAIRGSIAAGIRLATRLFDLAKSELISNLGLDPTVATVLDMTTSVGMGALENRLIQRSGGGASRLATGTHLETTLAAALSIAASPSAVTVRRPEASEVEPGATTLAGRSSGRTAGTVLQEGERSVEDAVPTRRERAVGDRASRTSSERGLESASPHATTRAVQGDVLPHENPARPGPSPRRSPGTAIMVRPPPLRLVEQGWSGLTATQLEGLRRTIGTTFTDPAVGILGELWRQVANSGDRAELARLFLSGGNKRALKRRARYLFGLQRERFWNAVRNRPEAKNLLESAGVVLIARRADGRFRGPFVRMRNESGAIVEITIDVDHIVKLADDPTRALSAANLRLMFRAENRRPVGNWRD